MNELIQAEQGQNAVTVSDGTKALIRSGVSENTIKAYGRALAGLRDLAMTNLMSDCLFRGSEVVTVNIEDIQDDVLEIHQG